MDNIQQQKKYEMMTTQPVSRLVSKMAVPSMVSMMISAIYNMVDTMWVGRISTQATAGVGVVFSYMTIIQAFALFFGMGSANYISRALGAKETDKASAMAATGFFSAFIAGIVIALLVLVFMRPFLFFLGATETVLPESINYLMFILPGTPFIMTSFTMNNQMRLQGNALISMIGISTGAVLNMILDPLFIFGLHMGVRGASLATSLSQLTGFLILLKLTGYRGGIRIRLKNFKPKWWHYKEIIAGGLPSIGRSGLSAVAAIALNRVARGYGDAALAAFSVVSRAMMVANSALIGFGQGFQPVCGFNYGAGKFDRVRAGFRFSTVVASVYCSVLALAGAVFAPAIVAAFRNDPEVIAYGTQVLRRMCISFPLMGYVTITNMYLQNIRKTVPATLISSARQGIIFIPMLYILNSLFALRGAMCTQPVSDILTFLLALAWAPATLRSMGTK